VPAVNSRDGIFHPWHGGNGVGLKLILRQNHAYPIHFNGVRIPNAVNPATRAALVNLSRMLAIGARLRLRLWTDARLAR